MKDLTVIIPLYKLNEDIHVDLLRESVKSVANQTSKPANVFIVGTKETCKDGEEALKEFTNILKENKIKSKIIKHEGSGTIQQQVNLAVGEVKTKYFSVLEADDTLFHKWFENVSKRIENDIKPVSLYLPIIYNINVKGELIRLSNEVVWSTSVSDEEEGLGFINSELLETFSDFQVTSGVFRTEDFLSVGGLKENLELFFWNELLLRMTNLDKKVYVISKYGGNHLVGLPFSFIIMAEEKYEEKDIDFWYDTIKEEYQYTEDREIIK